MVCNSLLKVSNNLKNYLNRTHRTNSLDHLKHLIQKLKIETGTGNQKALLTHNRDLTTNLDILGHIVWTLWLWLYIQFGTLVLLSNVL